MRTIIHNDNNIKEENIKNIVKRAKLLIINDKNEFLMVKTFDSYHILGGHVEKNESDMNTIERELKEEAGISIKLPLLLPFLTIKYYYEDTLYINNYYSYKSNVKPNYSKMHLTEDEKTWNFIPTFINCNNAISKVKECYNVCSNKNVLNDTIDALNTYLNNRGK